MRYLSALSIYYRAIIRDALRQFGRKKRAVKNIRIGVNDDGMSRGWKCRGKVVPFRSESRTPLLAI